MKKNYILCLILFCVFAVVFSSCSKSDVETPVAPVSYAEFQKWMAANVSKISWADTAYFYWQVLELRLDNKPVTSRGISFMNNPGPYVFPLIEQSSTSEHMRTFEIGSSSPIWCAHYRETATTVNLLVKTSSGKQFVWQNCPVKIAEHESNPQNLSWGVGIPKTIELVMADKMK